MKKFLAICILLCLSSVCFAHSPRFGTGDSYSVDEIDDFLAAINYAFVTSNDVLTDVNSTELETLSDGSDAGALHIHDGRYIIYDTFTTDVYTLDTASITLTAGTLEANELTDGTASITGGVGSGFTSLTVDNLTLDGNIIVSSSDLRLDPVGDIVVTSPILPVSDGFLLLGFTNKRWGNIYTVGINFGTNEILDGSITGPWNFNSGILTGINIDDGFMDGVEINASTIGLGTAAAGAFTELSASSNLILTIGKGSSILNDDDCHIFKTKGGSSYPFDQFGHLVIQARTSAVNRDIVFMGRTSDGVNKVIAVMSDDGFFGIGDKLADQGGPTTLFNAVTSNKVTISLHRNSEVADGGVIGAFEWRVFGSAALTRIESRVVGNNEDATKLVFSTGTGGTMSDQVEIDEVGNLIIISGNEQRYNDADNSDYVGFKAPALTATKVYQLPPVVGSDNDIIALTNAGTGVTEWKSRKDLGLCLPSPDNFISGTGEAGTDNTAQTVKTLVLLANSLTQVGDRIRIRCYWTGDTGGGITGTNTVNGITIAATTDGGAATFQVTEAWLHYIDATHANIISMDGGAINTTLSAANVDGFNFAADQDIDLNQDLVANNHIILYFFAADIFPKGI